jgi:hypothetical protein
MLAGAMRCRNMEKIVIAKKYGSACRRYHKNS